MNDRERRVVDAAVDAKLLARWTKVESGTGNTLVDGNLIIMTNGYFDGIKAGPSLEPSNNTGNCGTR